MLDKTYGKNVSVSNFNRCRLAWYEPCSLSKDAIESEDGYWGLEWDIEPLGRYVQQWSHWWLWRQVHSSMICTIACTNFRKNKVVLLLGYLHLLLEQGLRRNLKDYSEQPTRGLPQFSIMFPHCYNFSKNHWQGRGSLKPWKPHEAWMGLVSLQPHIFWKEIAKIYHHFQVELDELSMISKHLPGQAHLAQSGNNLQHWRVKPPSTWKGCSCKSCIQG